VKVRFSEPALCELRAAFDWYENERLGLGREFAIAVHHAIENIRQSQRTWPAIRPDLRKSDVGRFPYAVVYPLRDG